MLSFRQKSPQYPSFAKARHKPTKLIYPLAKLAIKMSRTSADQATQ
jgi:hypothetical protein